MINAITDLICPLDAEPMVCQDGCWRCANGHSYDIAKQGYVNLLPVQNKRSKDPGDSKAMVQARQRFLQQGYYQPLADAVADWVLATSPQRILDAGCGEGYYLRQLTAVAEQQQHSLSIAALDISKWAVQAAAKRDKGLSWLVASNNSIPLATGSIDSLLCIFGFPVVAEFRRVVAPDGEVVMVDPANDHLQELKQIIYPEVRDKPPQQPINDLHFALQEQRRVSFPITVSSTEDLQDLLAMTPHLYRSSAEGRARAAQLTELNLTVDVWLRRYRRQA